MTIGTFDGVHLGHQKMLNLLKEKGKEFNVPTVIVCFEPHPKEYFALKGRPHRLMNIREKYDAFSRLHIDYIWCLAFNKKLASLSAQAFVEDILLDFLDIKAIIIGSDFQYGYQREGNTQSLLAHGLDRGFEVISVPVMRENNLKISSTHLRRLIEQGLFAEAKSLLGFDYYMMGRVIKGEGRGRQVGVPTANVHVKPNHRPLHGVYAVYVELDAHRSVPGVANIGFRPTVNGKNFLLEVHLFDFRENIYGQQIKVSFIDKIRDEKKFSSFDELLKQIHQDIEQSKLRLQLHE